MKWDSGRVKRKDESGSGVGGIGRAAHQILTPFPGLILFPVSVPRESNPTTLVSFSSFHPLAA